MVQQDVNSRALAFRFYIPGCIDHLTLADIHVHFLLAQTFIATVNLVDN